MSPETPLGKFVVQRLQSRNGGESYLLHIGMKKDYATWILDEVFSTNPADGLTVNPAAAHAPAFVKFEGMVDDELIYVWDQGELSLDSKGMGGRVDYDELYAAIQAGEFNFKLNGMKLRGTYQLSRKSKGTGKWQLCKADDLYATRIGSVEFANNSVVTESFPTSFQAAYERKLSVWADSKADRYSTVNDDQAITSLLPMTRQERDGSFDKLASTKNFNVRFAKLDKIFFPELSLTRQGVLAYYHFISPFLLRYLEDKPAIVKRYPQGIHEKVSDEIGNVRHPSWLRVANLFGESNKTRHTYPIVDNNRALLHLINQSGIEVTSWGSKLGSPESPDFCYISIIPNKCPAKFLTLGAFELRSILEKVGFSPVCKTTGKGYGLDICFGIAPGAKYDDLTKFCTYIEKYLTTKMGNVFCLDFKQSEGRLWFMTRLNKRARGLVAPYSLRANSWAGVSTPITWNELANKFQPQSYNFDTIFHRLREKGDLFKPIIEKKGDLNVALRLLVQNFPIEQKPSGPEGKAIGKPQMKLRINKPKPA